MSSARALASLLLLAYLAGVSTASAAGRYDPRLRFRTIRTPHFDVHAHQGEEALARRLAGIVERVRQKFVPVFGVARGRVQVILVDQTDLSNGWATPVPYDTIEITAVPPAAETLIGNTTDWLELVFTHEYTHILHLDRTRGFMQGVRRVFGRVPVAFPNGFLPIWQIEGIATFEESRMTGEGRVPAGDFRALVDVAAAERRFEPIDRASGGLDDWPGGNAPYAYGAYFHQFLADRYGAERLTDLADRTSGRLPFFGAGAFKKVFGRSSGDLWKDFRQARARTSLPRSETDARATRLTHHGFVVSAARVADDDAIYYRIANPDGFPALMVLPPGGGTPRRVAWRALGNRTSVRGEWIVFDQVERVRSVALYSDLYAVRLGGGKTRVHRLTKDARAGDPDLSPDGRRIICTVQAGGRRALALLDFSAAAVRTPRVLLDQPDADYTGPRWSPDGRQIVAERRRAGVHELVLIDSDTRAVRVLAARTDARLVTPSWTADGAAVLFSASSSDGPFNVYAIDLAGTEVRQVTDSSGGAQFPELSRDGRLTYVGYTPAGYDLFSVTTDRAAWKKIDVGLKAEVTGRERRTEATASVRQAEAAGGQNPAAAAPTDATDYNPRRTLAPTFWTPVVDTDAGELVVGAGTAMYDTLGRHAYALDAGWTANRARPDWHAVYAYDRWRPTLFASYADDTDPIRGGTVRSREVFAGMLLPFRHVRRSETLLAGFDAQSDSLTCEASGTTCRTAHRELRSLRSGWLHDTRRIFGYSISPEEGVAVQAAIETSRTELGSDVDGGAATFDARAYRRLARTHMVVAGRLAAAGSWGPIGARRRYSAGGSGPAALAFDFGRDAIGLLRGFAPDDLVGSRAAVANIDLRFPLARVQRGAGSWPLFLRSIHGAAFVDAGHAWDAAFRSADLRTAAGGELSMDLVVFHYLPLTFAGGGAWTRDPAAPRGRARVFGRIGYAF